MTLSPQILMLISNGLVMNGFKPIPQLLDPRLGKPFGYPINGWREHP